MTPRPEIAREPRSPEIQGAGSLEVAVDQGSDSQSVGPRGADLSLESMDGFGTLYQSLTTHWMVRQC